MKRSKENKTVQDSLGNWAEMDRVVGRNGPSMRESTPLGTQIIFCRYPLGIF